MDNHMLDLFSKQQCNTDNFFLIAGPCVVENDKMVDEIAGSASAICKNCIPLHLPGIIPES